MPSGSAFYIVVPPAVPLFEKRAAVVQGKVEAPESLGEGEEAEDETGQHLSCTVTQPNPCMACGCHLFSLKRAPCISPNAHSTHIIQDIALSRSALQATGPLSKSHVLYSNQDMCDVPAQQGVKCTYCKVDIPCSLVYLGLLWRTILCTMQKARMKARQMLPAFLISGCMSFNPTEAGARRSAHFSVVTLLIS